MYEKACTTPVWLFAGTITSRNKKLLAPLLTKKRIIPSRLDPVDLMVIDCTVVPMAPEALVAVSKRDEPAPLRLEVPTEIFTIPVVGDYLNIWCIHKICF